MPPGVFFIYGIIEIPAYTIKQCFKKIVIA